MPDTTATPDASADAPPRARKKRAAKAKAATTPAAPKRRRPADAPPVQTLDRRVAQMGPTHAEALRVLSRADPTFKADLRDEMARLARLVEASETFNAVEAALQTALDEKTAAAAAYDSPHPRTAALDRLAKSIAAETGATDVDDDSDPSDARLDDEAAVKRGALVSQDDPRNVAK